MNEFVLPDVGEGLTEADITAWKVAPGDTVAVNDILVEIETAKSLVELPSPFAGDVAELLVAEGSTVAVGTPIIRIVSEGDSGAEESAPITEETAPIAEESAPVAEESAGKVLVGYGVSGTPQSTQVRLRGGRPVSPSETPAAPEAPAASRPRATPPVRAYAKQQGVDLSAISGTGPNGRVLRSDVERHLHDSRTRVDSVGDDAHAGRSPAGPREERSPLKGVRKAIAQAMVRSYTEVPHAGVSTEFDITPTMDFIAELKTRRAYEGMKITPLLFVAKALIRATRLHPRINTMLDGDEIVQRHYINLGIAAATPRGLIVPNIKDAHTLSLIELEAAITDLVTTAREGKTAPEDQAGGTITITNAGIFGVDTGSPIINPGEPAIVGMSAIREKPWVVDGQVVPRMVTNLGVTVDHRILDGDVAGAFLSSMVEALTDPRMLIME